MEMFKYQIEYLYIILFTGSGLVVGLFFESIVRKINEHAKKTKFKWDDIIVGSMRNYVWFLTLVLSFLIASNWFSPSEHFSKISNHIVFSLVVLILCAYLSRVLVKTIRLKTDTEEGALPASSIILNIVRIACFIIAGMFILQHFGVSITPILTALGVGGLAIALALQETLSNLFSGIQIIASKKIKSNDYIRTDAGIEGYVQDITWRNTVVRTMQNNMVIIPNSKFSTSVITNFNLPEMELSVPVEVGVSYDSDLEKVEKVTIETAIEIMQRMDEGVKDFTPAVRYHTFAGSSINFSISLRCHEFGNQYVMKHEFIKELTKKYREHQIEIPYPINTVLLKNQSH